MSERARRETRLRPPSSVEDKIELQDPRVVKGYGMTKLATTPTREEMSRPPLVHPESCAAMGASSDRP